MGNQDAAGVSHYYYLSMLRWHQVVCIILLHIGVMFKSTETRHIASCPYGLNEPIQLK
jgi:hypothetical protein